MRKIVVSLLATAAVVGATVSAKALPTAPEPAPPVVGIPQPCASMHPWPGKDVPMSQIKKRFADTFGFKVAGPQWTEANRRSIKILWETLDAVGCTPYLSTLKSKVNGHVGINGASISGFAWGDWSLTRNGYLTLDFTKFARAFEMDDEGRLARLVIHELAHVHNSDRFSEPKYWRSFKKLQSQMHRKVGPFSAYAGDSVTETFADVVGYYVARCADNNPYDTGRYDAYYEFTRDWIFDGREFGPAPGEKPSCSVKPVRTKEPEVASWVEALSGE